VLGTWEIGKGVKVSWYMLAPAISTASFPHKIVTYNDLASLNSMVDTLSPRSTGRQGYSINEDYGRIIIGRLCPSFVTLIQRGGGEREILTRANDFNFLHMVSNRLPSCLNVNDKVRRLGITLETLRKFERIAPRQI
jgi:hypothetical protein